MSQTKPKDKPATGEARRGSQDGTRDNSKWRANINVDVGKLDMVNGFRSGNLSYRKNSLPKSSETENQNMPGKHVTVLNINYTRRGSAGDWSVSNQNTNENESQQEVKVERRPSKKVSDLIKQFNSSPVSSVEGRDSSPEVPSKKRKQSLNNRRSQSFTTRMDFTTSDLCNRENRADSTVVSDTSSSICSDATSTESNKNSTDLQTPSSNRSRVVCNFKERYEVLETEKSVPLELRDVMIKDTPVTVATDKNATESSALVRNSPANSDNNVPIQEKCTFVHHNEKSQKQKPAPMKRNKINDAHSAQTTQLRDPEKQRNGASVINIKTEESDLNSGDISRNLKRYLGTRAIDQNYRPLSGFVEKTVIKLVNSDNNMQSVGTVDKTVISNNNNQSSDTRDEVFSTQSLGTPDKESVSNHATQFSGVSLPPGLKQQSSNDNYFFGDMNDQNGAIDEMMKAGELDQNRNKIVVVSKSESFKSSTSISNTNEPIPASKAIQQSTHMLKKQETKDNGLKSAGMQVPATLENAEQENSITSKPSSSMAMLREDLTDLGIKKQEYNRASDRINTNLHKLKSELMAFREQDVALLKQLIYISQTIQKISRAQILRHSKSLSFSSSILNPRLYRQQQRVRPLVRQNSAPHTVERRRLLFGGSRSNTEDEYGSTSSFEESEFDSQSELDESTSSLCSLYPTSPKSPRSRALLNSRFTDVILCRTVAEDSDISYDDILKRNVRLWKMSSQRQDPVIEEVTCLL